MIEISNELSEIAGAFAADGCLQPQYLCMWGNIYQDKDYYDFIIKPFFKKAFNIDIRPHEKRSNSVYGFYLCKKEIVKFFNKKLNFPIGKKTYTVSVPPKIFKSKNLNLYSTFIRGFADCDGGINFHRRYGTYSLFKRTYHVYPRVEIRSVSYRIIKQISFMLKRLKINNKIELIVRQKENEADAYRISLRGSKIIDFINKIGFNNPAQITKYLIWKKFGFCPSYTTLGERKKILKGEISPYSYYGPVAQPG